MTILVYKLFVWIILLSTYQLLYGILPLTHGEVRKEWRCQEWMDGLDQGISSKILLGSQLFHSIPKTKVTGA